LILIALINAPFDWASLGLTRALFTAAGSNSAGPYVLGLADALAGDRRDPSTSCPRWALSFWTPLAPSPNSICRCECVRLWWGAHLMTTGSLGHYVPFVSFCSHRQLFLIAKKRTPPWPSLRKLRFKIVRTNSHDEVIARANNLLVARAAYETAPSTLSA